MDWDTTSDTTRTSFFFRELGDQKINFLDLKVSLADNEFSYGIYRKPTATDVMIHGSSFYPLSHKLLLDVLIFRRIIDFWGFQQIGPKIYFISDICFDFFTEWIFGRF